MEESVEQLTENQEPKDKQDKIPHVASILFRAEICPVTPIGQISNVPIEKLSRIFTIYGNTVDQCRENFQHFLEKVYEIYEQSKNSTS